MLIKRIMIALLALLLSAFLILSIPTINYWMKNSAPSKEFTTVAKVSVKKVEIKKKKAEPKKKLRQPKRQKPTRTNLTAGPRFTMDLGVAGSRGVAVDVNTVQAGKGGQPEDGDVDEKPLLNGEPQLDLPSAIKKAGINAMAVLSFCVDVSGVPYDLQVIEETPAGMGMAVAARMAIQKARFTPAKKEGRSVAFCGMQQPFEVRFD